MNDDAIIALPARLLAEGGTRIGWDIAAGDGLALDKVSAAVVEAHVVLVAVVDPDSLVITALDTRQPS